MQIASKECRKNGHEDQYLDRRTLKREILDDLCNVIEST